MEWVIEFLYSETTVGWTTLNSHGEKAPQTLAQAVEIVQANQAIDENEHVPGHFTDRVRSVRTGQVVLL